MRARQLLLSLVLLLGAAAALEPELEAPPMGWSTWDSLGLDINETVVLEVTVFFGGAGRRGPPFGS